MKFESIRAAIGRRRRPRILCHFNHYFGTTSAFVGKSTAGNSETRGAIVRAALDGLRALPCNMRVRVCGLPGHSLLPIDADLGASVTDPRHIVYASIQKMFDHLDNYDYFLNIEDDIAISQEFIDNCIAFNAVSDRSDVYLPNRMEFHLGGASDCVDLVANPRWNPALARSFRGTDLGVAHTPHSGLAFLSRAQMQYATERISLASRELIEGGFMASAYANLHAPFLLWRARQDVMAHHVVHLDNWLHREPGTLNAPALRSPAHNGKPLGSIDAVTLEGERVRIRGWAAMPDGRGAREIQLRLNDHDLPVQREPHLALLDRPDVASVHRHVRPDCGFELTAEAAPLFHAGDAAAPLRLTVAFRSDPDEAFAIVPEDGLVKAMDDLRIAIGALPAIPDRPFMPEDVTARILELMRGSACYLEYGTGGTTQQALDIGIPDIVAVESDSFWLEGVRAKRARHASASRCHFIHADIGPTGEWGAPVSDSHWKNYHNYALSGWTACREHALSPDLVLIDGRFRVACALASLVLARPGCRIVIDDYLDRPHYAAVERFVAPERLTGRAAEFIVPADLQSQDIWLALLDAVTDPA